MDVVLEDKNKLQLVQLGIVILDRDPSPATGFLVNRQIVRTKILFHQCL